MSHTRPLTGRCLHTIDNLMVCGDRMAFGCGTLSGIAAMGYGIRNGTLDETLDWRLNGSAGMQAAEGGAKLTNKEARMLKKAQRKQKQKQKRDGA